MNYNRRSVRLNVSRVWIFRALPLLVLPLLVAVSAATLGFQSNHESTPEVQQLVVQAEEAQKQGDTLKSIEKYLAVIRLAPHLASAYNNLGMLYLKQTDYSHAAEVLKRALELEPGMHTARAMLGMTYFQLGLNDKAEPLLKEELKANPKDDSVEMTLALVLMNLKNWEEAASHLNNFLNRNPRSVEGWYLLRKTYLEMSEDAVAKITEIDSDSVVAHEIAGERDESGLNYTGAIAEYQKAIAKAPHEPGTHMSLGNVYWRIGKWESAQAEFSAELRNNPKNCIAHWKLADTMLEVNSSSEDALSELNRSIELCPTLTEARIDRARALIRLGKQSDALPDLLTAKKDRPGEPTIYFLLASVYKAQGKTSEAQQELRLFEQMKSESAAQR